jgi:hypothetical protein
MTTSTHVRPRGLSRETQRKVDKILAAAPKMQRIKRIRAGLADIITASEKEWERRRTLGEGNTPPKLLIDVIGIEQDFDALMLDLHQ